MPMLATNGVAENNASFPFGDDSLEDPIRDRAPIQGVLCRGTYATVNHSDDQHESLFTTEEIQAEKLEEYL